MPKEIVTCTRPKYLSWPAVQSSNILLWGQSGYASQTLDSRSKGRKNKKTAPKDMFLLHANMFDRILTMWQILPPPPFGKSHQIWYLDPLIPYSVYTELCRQRIMHLFKAAWKCIWAVALGVIASVLVACGLTATNVTMNSELLQELNFFQQSTIVPFLCIILLFIHT